MEITCYNYSECCICDELGIQAFDNNHYCEKHGKRNIKKIYVRNDEWVAEILLIKGDGVLLSTGNSRYNWYSRFAHFLKKGEKIITQATGDFFKKIDDQWEFEH